MPWRSAEAVLRGVRRLDIRPLAGPRRGGGIWRRPPIPGGSLVVIYASGPRRVRGIVGEFEAGRVYTGPPGVVASLVPGGLRALPRGLLGYSELMVVEIAGVCRYSRRIPLEEIRRLVPGWQPPPGYRPLRPGDGLHSLVEAVRLESGCGYSPSRTSRPSGGRRGAR